MLVANGVKGGANDTVILDERAECQHRESEKERADWDSESTDLDEEEEEEEEEEEGEWYDSDDTAFEYEDDGIREPWPQTETFTKLEPEGMWSSSEAITVDGPW